MPGTIKRPAECVNYQGICSSDTLCWDSPFSTYVASDRAFGHKARPVQSLIMSKGLEVFEGSVKKVVAGS